MSGYRMLIGGQLVEGESTLEVLNPATEEVVAACPRASKAQLDQAVAAAKAAFPAWSATPIETRKQALVAIADVLKANVDVLGRLLTQEQGKPLRDATGEVLGTAAFFRYFAGLDLEPRVVEDSPKRHVTLRRRPLGVVAAIMPWNFPLIMLGFKIPAALLAGNTVVAKPAATTPLTALKFAELVKDLLPAGVLNIITDANDLGGELTRHPDVRKVSFTGSTETGRKVMAGAADMLKRITLELGGNDAAIVLADQDPKAVAPKIFGGAFANGGQICVAIKRVYAHESIYDELCDELAKLAEAHVVATVWNRACRWARSRTACSSRRCSASSRTGVATAR
jgi:acyl-CoA reductase-like NAD-dependent aldehyde dehydrogenase